MHKTYAYDAFNRPAGYTVQYDPHFYPETGQLDSPIFAVAPEYTVAIDYDTYFARPKAVTYPQERLRTYTKYDLNGFVVEEGNSLDYNSAAVFYRQVTAMTATGQVTAETFGNGKVQTYDYHPATFQMTGTEVPGLIDLNYTHDRFGNLVRQAEGVQNSIETFEYDHLHRMTQSSRSVAGTANPNPIDYTYDALGNITKKSDYGSSYSYGAGTAGPNAVTSVTLATGGTASFGYDANGNMTTGSNTTGSPLTGNFAAHYDAQNKPFRLARGVGQSEFWYGSDQQRYYQRDEQGRWTFYVDKLYEQKSSTLHKLYLGDYGVFTVDVTSGQNSGITYLHKDRLGSIVAMTDETGNPVQNADRGFDPFGKPREGNWGDSDNGDEVPFPNQRNGDLNRPDQTTRGFTGHEHLNNVAITHMNGRAYDYNLGRFLSVDPVIQFPANSQSLNPYSYIMNNPLSGTDPTGYSTCTEPTNKECNPPEEEAKPRDKIGSTTYECNHGAACRVIRFNGGDSRMSSEDSNEGNKSPDQIGATVNRDNTQSMGEMAGPEGSGCMVPLRCAGGDAVVSFAGTEFANGALSSTFVDNRRNHIPNSDPLDHSDDSRIPQNGFNNQQDAAQFGLTLAAEKGLNVEFGGGVFELNGRFFITEPVGIGNGTEFRANIGLPKGATLTRLYHLHPGDSDAIFFTELDINTATRFNVTSTIGIVRDRSIRVFIPGVSPVENRFIPGSKTKKEIVSKGKEICTSKCF